MARPSRKSISGAVPSGSRTYFVSTATAGRRALLQSEAMASLFIEVLRSYTAQGEFKVHEFVVMRNHVHVLLTVPAGMTIEKAVQLIKGKFFISRKEGSGVRMGDMAEGFLGCSHYQPRKLCPPR